MLAVRRHVRTAILYEVRVVGARPDQTPDVVVVRHRDRAQPVAVSRLQVARQTRHVRVLHGTAFYGRPCVKLFAISYRTVVPSRL